MGGAGSESDGKRPSLGAQVSAESTGSRARALKSAGGTHFRINKPGLNLITTRNARGGLGPFRMALSYFNRLFYFLPRPRTAGRGISLVTRIPAFNQKAPADKARGPFWRRCPGSRAGSPLSEMSRLVMLWISAMQPSSTWAPPDLSCRNTRHKAQSLLEVRPNLRNRRSLKLGTKKSEILKLQKSCHGR